MKKFLNDQHKLFLEKFSPVFLASTGRILAQQMTEFQKNKDLKADIGKILQDVRPDLPDEICVNFNL